MDLVEILFLAICSYTDIKNRIIYTWCCICFGIIGIICIMFNNGEIKDIGICILPGISMLIISFISRQQIGYGDAIMIIVCGLISGLGKVILLCFAAFVLVLLYSIFCLVTKRKTVKDKVAFAPFLFAGNVVEIIICLL